MGERFFIGLLPNTKGGVTQFLIPTSRRESWNAVLFSGKKAGDTSPLPLFAVPLELPGTLTFTEPRFE